MLYRNISPAAPGISLGYYEVLGRYAGEKLIRRIKGTLVDATALFLNPEVEREFKQIIDEELALLLVHTDKEEERKELEQLRYLFGEYPLDKLCKIVVTREKLFSKHILIQVYRIDKPLNNYAAHEPGNKFTLGQGFLSNGVITGVMDTFPQRWEIYKLGKATVHLFKPDAEGIEAKEELPRWLERIALHAPAAVELNHMIKSLRDQLQQKDEQLLRMGEDLAAVSTERDGLHTAVEGFTTKGKDPFKNMGVPHRFGISDLISLTLPTIIGYYIAGQTKIEPIVGVFIGLLIGSFLIARKRR